MPDLLSQRSDDALGVLAVYLDQQHETRVPLDQRGDVGVAPAGDQIPLPVTGNGPILCFDGPFPNGDGVGDAASALSLAACMLATAHGPHAAQV